MLVWSAKRHCRIYAMAGGSLREGADGRVAVVCGVRYMFWLINNSAEEPATGALGGVCQAKALSLRHTTALRPFRHLSLHGRW